MSTYAERLQAEIDRSNAVTAISDRTVHDAITSLINGYGQGGGDLNFKITAYPMGTDMTSVSGQNGDIAVLSETAITNWVVSATEPQSPSNGMVWIDVDNLSNATNLSKDNEFNIYPSFCRQFINGNWTLTEAYIFNNSWVKFSSMIIYLIKDGKMLYPFSITGGSISSIKDGNIDVVSFRTVGKTDTQIAYVSIGGANKLKKINIEIGWGESARKTRIPCIGIGDTIPTILSDGDVGGLAAYTKMASVQNFHGTFSCDIPTGLNSEPYIVLAVTGAGGIYGYMNIINLWLD